MNLEKYSKIVKVLVFIPVITAVLTFSESMLPLTTINTKVISKEKTYKEKTDHTTYTINFEEINDQFTEEIYTVLEQGNEVELKITYFNKQIKEVTQKETNIKYENSTFEEWALYGFAIIFLLCGLAWTKKGTLNEGIAVSLAFPIFISLIQLVRMF